MCTCSYTLQHTYRDRPTERTLNRNQHEVNTFYVALKALIDLWIHLLCLRKVSLAFPLKEVARKWT